MSRKPPRASSPQEPSLGALTRDQARRLKLDDALLKEIQWNRPDRAAALLAQTPPADPDARDANGRPALLAALSLGHLECADALLRSGASLEARSGGGDSLLISMAERFKTPAAAKGMRWLIDHGADLNHVANSGLTALGVLASIQGHESAPLALPLALELLHAGADPDAGRLLPLQLALYGQADRPRLLEALLHHGANPALKPSPDGISALEVASMSDNGAALRLMRSAIEARALAASTPNAPSERSLPAPRL